MKNKYIATIRTSYSVRVCSLLLVLFCLLLYGCYKLKSVTHPTTAQTNSYFDVTFVCDPDNPNSDMARGMFGALLPKGWRVQDYTDYTVHFNNGGSF